MTGSSDRVAAPTNGHHPPLSAAVLESPASSSERAASASEAPEGAEALQAAPGDPAEPRIRIEVTPTQVAVGLGILASIVLLLLGRRRRDDDA